MLVDDAREVVADEDHVHTHVRAGALAERRQRRSRGLHDLERERCRPARLRNAGRLEAGELVRLRSGDRRRRNARRGAAAGRQGNRRAADRQQRERTRSKRRATHVRVLSRTGSSHEVERSGRARARSPRAAAAGSNGDRRARHARSPRHGRARRRQRGSRPAGVVRAAGPRAAKKSPSVIREPGTTSTTPVGSRVRAGYEHPPEIFIAAGRAQRRRNADPGGHEHDKTTGEQLEMGTDTPLGGTRAGEPGDRAVRGEQRPARPGVIARRPGRSASARRHSTPAQPPRQRAARRRRRQAWRRRLSSPAALRDRELRGRLDRRPGRPPRAVAEEPRQRDRSRR